MPAIMTLEHSLATWLPAQRWFPRGNAAVELAIIADTPLASGDPELRHLVVGVSCGGDAVRYQVLAGVRAEVPKALQHAVIGPDGRGGTAYDALHDPELTRVLLLGIASERAAGPLRFVAEPGAPIDTTAGSLVLSAEQSNTSLIFGESAILKVFRRVFPGQNPDLEVAHALAGLGSPHVARPFGWIEAGLNGDEPALLAILSEYLRGACDGWSLAETSLRDLYAADASRAADAGGDFDGEPATPLARRRSRSPALQDVAGMLRSFDYAARHQLAGHPDAARLAGSARDWVARNSAAFCAGYTSASGTDPGDQGV